MDVRVGKGCSENGRSFEVENVAEACPRKFLGK